MLNWVPDVTAILGFGFLGLSFLMVYLGYRITTQVVAQGEEKSQSIRMAKFFLVIALVFMVLAGPLQAGLIWFQSYSKKAENSYVLRISPLTSWEDEYGTVYIICKGERTELSKDHRWQGNISHQEAIDIDLSRVEKFIEKMRAQIEKTNENKNTPEKKEALTGG